MPDGTSGLLGVAVAAAGMALGAAWSVGGAQGIAIAARTAWSGRPGGDPARAASVWLAAAHGAAAGGAVGAAIPLGAGAGRLAADGRVAGADTAVAGVALALVGVAAAGVAASRLPRAPAGRPADAPAESPRVASALLAAPLLGHLSPAAEPIAFLADPSAVALVGAAGAGVAWLAARATLRERPGTPREEAARRAALWTAGAAGCSGAGFVGFLFALGGLLGCHSGDAGPWIAAALARTTLATLGAFGCLTVAVWEAARASGADAEAVAGATLPLTLANAALSVGGALLASLTVAGPAWAR